MRFTKMHGAGNDYVYVNCFDEPMPDDPAELARRVSDRHFGVGGDGLILICPSTVADARMRMFNADGSEAEMCGNGVRCVAKYVYDHGICRNKTLRIETGSGVLSLELEIADEKVRRVRVDMGEPILEPARIPVELPSRSLPIESSTFPPTSISRRPTSAWMRRLRMGLANDVRFDGQSARGHVLSRRSRSDRWSAFVGRASSGSRISPSGSTSHFVEVHLAARSARCGPGSAAAAIRWPAAPAPARCAWPAS